MPANLFLHHLRLGFATNCSSSHSVIFLPGLQDDLSGVREGRYLGWNDDAPSAFVLASREAKLPYLRLQLEATKALDDELRALCGSSLEAGELDSYSTWKAPPELAREIARWALKDGVAILASGDNGSYHPLSTRDAIDPADFRGCLVRRDPLGFWTLFSTWSGLKLRLSFAETAKPQVLPFRSTWPETVDLKITNRCRSGCSFCYQDSRPDGDHARLEDVLSILDKLAEAQVMEVVLGGGEPTQHPQFWEILSAVQKRGMRVAFTTRRLDWMDGKVGDVDLALVRWAYSLSEPAEIPEIPGRFKFRVRPAIHVVLGTELSRPESLREIASHCRKHYLQLVLLGFKRKGRARDLEPLDSSHWLDTLTIANERSVAIDALVASEYELELQRRGIPSWLCDFEDGRFAMHVDAVRGLCGPSSYCDERELFPLPSGKDAIQVAFEEINQRLGPSRRERALLLEQAEAQKAADPAAGLVTIDAALEGRCERCGASGASATEGGLRRPKSLCPRCLETAND